MSIRFEINKASLVNNRQLVAWYRLFAAECLVQAQALAAARIKGGSGVYERSFTFELRPGNPPILYFGNKAKHAIYVEEDTKDHFVAPVNKKALRWFDPPPPRGRTQGRPQDAAFSKGHKVRGTEGKHIVRDAVSAAGDNLRSGSHRAANVD